MHMLHINNINYSCSTGWGSANRIKQCLKLTTTKKKMQDNHQVLKKRNNDCSYLLSRTAKRFYKFHIYFLHITHFTNTNDDKYNSNINMQCEINTSVLREKVVTVKFFTFSTKKKKHSSLCNPSLTA